MIGEMEFNDMKSILLIVDLRGKKLNVVAVANKLILLVGLNWPQENGFKLVLL